MVESDRHIIFTLCSNNYLSRTKILCESVRRFQPDRRFVVGLVDKKKAGIPYQALGCEVVEVASIESRFTELAEKYSVVELNTCIKPRFFEYLFDLYNAASITYLDPDICLYNPMTEATAVLGSNDVVLTPHILTPIPLDGKRPDEPLFLNYGIFNLGYLGLSRSAATDRFLLWWKERTYRLGFDNPAKGLFTDQLWINLVPQFFDHVHVLKHPGYNMGPWNLHERELSEINSFRQVNERYPLVFYHFSGIPADPLKFHWDYDRFSFQNRPDLIPLYAEYRAALALPPFSAFASADCYYAGLRKNYLLRSEIPGDKRPRPGFRQRVLHRFRRYMEGNTQQPGKPHFQQPGIPNS